MRVALSLAKFLNEGKITPDNLRALLDHNHIDLADYIGALEGYNLPVAMPTPTATTFMIGNDIYQNGRLIGSQG